MTDNKSTYPQSGCQKIHELILLLELAIRLDAGFAKGFIDRECFTRAVTLDEKQGFFLNKRDCVDDVELKPRFHNLVLVTLAALVIAIDKALDEKFCGKKPEETDTINSLRAFFYMLRCACAHNIVDPQWVTKPKYQKSYKVIIPAEVFQKRNDSRSSDLSYQFDFATLNEKGVEFNHFGGLLGLIDLAFYAYYLLEDESGELSGEV